MEGRELQQEGEVWGVGIDWWVRTRIPHLVTKANPFPITEAR